MDYAGGSNVITKVLKRERGWQKEPEKWQGEKDWV